MRKRTALELFFHQTPRRHDDIRAAKKFCGNPDEPLPVAKKQRVINSSATLENAHARATTFKTMTLTMGSSSARFDLVVDVWALIGSFLTRSDRAILLLVSRGMAQHYWLGITRVKITMDHPVVSTVSTTGPSLSAESLSSESSIVFAARPNVTLLQHDLADVRVDGRKFVSLNVARSQSEFGYVTSLLAPHRKCPLGFVGRANVCRPIYRARVEHLPYNLREPQGLLTMAEHETLINNARRLLYASNGIRSVTSFGSEGLSLLEFSELLKRHQRLQKLDLDCVWTHFFRRAQGSMVW